MESKYSIIKSILAMRTRRTTDTPSSTAQTIVDTDPKITTANYHPPAPQTMTTRRAVAVSSPAFQRNTTQNFTVVYDDQTMTSRKRTALPTTSTPRRQLPTLASQNSTIHQEQITTPERRATLPTTTSTSRQSPALVPQNSTIYEQIMASRRTALQISTRRQTPAPATSNRKTNWCYNEEKDEEEPFGFKKEFFYNNDDFYTKYR